VNGAAPAKAAKPAAKAKAAPKAAAKPEEVAEEKPKGRGRTAKAAPAAEVVEEAPVAEEAKEDAKPRGRGRGKKAEATEGEAAPERESKGGRERREEADVEATEEDAEALLAMLEEIIESGDMQASVKISQREGRYVHLSIEGEDASHLIGRRGEVLNSLQYLLNVFSGRKVRPGIRVVLDADAYRDHRKDVLTDLATQIAEQVVARGEEAVLDALPAFERRVIHQILADFEGVQTYSEGEEPNRRVVIAPIEEGAKA
jgi:spoIIIJ-associated protein